MIRGALGLGLLLATGFSVGIHWINENHQFISVRAQNVDHQFADQCVSGGLKLRYRFEMQLCKRRVVWFDSCKDPLVQVNSIQYEAVTNAYRLESDQLRDPEQPITRWFPTFEEALRHASTIDSLDIVELAEGDLGFVRSSRSYVAARITSDCKGEYSRAVQKISSFLTLGLVQISGHDTGWYDFEL